MLVGDAIVHDMPTFNTGASRQAVLSIFNSKTTGLLLPQGEFSRGCQNKTNRCVA